MAEEQAERQNSQQTEIPQNTVTIEDVGTLRKKITIEIPRERIEQKLDEQYGQLSHEAIVPGFRKGRAPRRLIEKRFGKEVLQTARNELVVESYQAAIEQEQLEVLGEPEIDLESIELPQEGPLSFSVEVEVAPEFELPALEEIEIEPPQMELTEQMVDDAIARLCASRGVLEPVTEGPAQKDDYILADVKMQVDGEIVDQQRNVEMNVRPGAVLQIWIEQLGEMLEGAHCGQTVTCTSTIGPAYSNEQLRGKQAEFEITIREIKRLKPAELNEQFLESLGFANEQQLREHVRADMQTRLQLQRQRAMRQQMCDYLLKNTPLELPEGLASRHAQRILHRRYTELLLSGVPREQIDENLQRLQAASTQQANDELKLFFILEKIAAEQQIEVSEEEINGEIARLAISYGRRPSRLREELERRGALQELRIQIRENKTLQKLLEKARIKTPEKTEKTNEQPEKDSESATQQQTSEARKRSTAKRRPPASKRKPKTQPPAAGDDAT